MVSFGALPRASLRDVQQITSSVYHAKYENVLGPEQIDHAVGTRDYLSQLAALELRDHSAGPWEGSKPLHRLDDVIH